MTSIKNKCNWCSGDIGYNTLESGAEEKVMSILPLRECKTAVDFLKRGEETLRERAAEREAKDGEKTMYQTTKAFGIATGLNMSVEQGYLFMALHKLVRSQQGAYDKDNYIDGLNYFALAGEAALTERT